MKVRAITAGTNYRLPFDGPRFALVGDFLNRAREAIEKRGVEVQTTRVTGERVNEFLEHQGPGAIVELAENLDAACQKEGVDLGSIGTLDIAGACAPARFAVELASAVGRNERVFASVLAVSPGLEVNRASVLESARVVKSLSEASPDGFNTRRFALGANIPPDGPFFPTSYHDGGSNAFSIALEGADLAVEAFGRNAEIEVACSDLIASIEERCRPVEEACLELESRYGWRYIGIDVSLAPFPSPEVSIAGACEYLGGGPFGAPGTLTAVRTIKRALKEVRIRKCGFCGVMLPVLEDSVLASRVAEDRVTVDQLLLYSAVCGTGLDTIPVPGDATEEQLASVMLDVCTLSAALSKPLTARLMPVPGKTVGDFTDFRSPFFCNTLVMPLPQGEMRHFFKG
ncbi:MAG: DUF711 family protein [Dehalococcoidia bacterium]|nr:DUF711 family protein [Dehalococcoidia bacterium]